METTKEAHGTAVAKKVYEIFKSALFLSAGVLIIVFNEIFLENDGRLLQYIVGGIMIYFGADEVLTALKKSGKMPHILGGSVTFLLGCLVVLCRQSSENRLAVICVSWAVWTIMRESEEIYKKVVLRFDEKLLAILNLAESVAVIILSALMFLDPAEHHAKVHLIILGAEIILEIAWDYLYLFCRALKAKRETPEKEENVTAEETVPKAIPENAEKT